ncbi:hypothetical protein FHL15_008078 [Xylaria flabelliformis]|uniref:Glycosyl hydrolase family 13 catalytic domain-containing protein n=1 Tax=Xylaria flabelliformis TaxID=2512241 RepID=A0A553HT06_9PEZI|nr:hypothetical protein FHL15_008078 [Xylaria flabelliformis]
MVDQAAESEATSIPASTGEDWEEVKKDLKQLVHELRSLAPKPEADEPQRQFDCDPEDWLKWIRPTPERVEKLDCIPSLMFTEDDVEFLLGISHFSKYIPSFGRNLTLRFVADSDSQDTSLRDRNPHISAAQVRDYIMGLRLSPVTGGRYYVNETSTSWKWPCSYFDFDLYHIFGETDLGRYNLKGPINTEYFSIVSSRAADRGYGTLCLVSAPVKEGVLDLRPVKFVLAQINRWNYTGIIGNELDRGHSALVMYFLGVFAGKWSSRNERSKFSLDYQHYPLVYRTFSRWTLQVHFRYFTSVRFPMGAQQNAGGLRCHREHGQIFSKALNVALKEERISVIGLIFTERNAPAFYSVLALGETNFGTPRDYNLKFSPGLEGTIAFQIAVLTSVDVWEKEWNSVLDSIDDCIRFRLDHTLRPEEIEKWMFDDNFERSRLYLTILQTLRIFGEYIGTVSDDLRLLDDLFSKNTNFPMNDMRRHELQALRSNWELVRETQKKVEQDLLSRISSKTEEVKTFRDGLFNASSLREANRSSVMGRYVIIFTVVTVLYLPPNFISTVLNMSIFAKDIAQWKWEFKVATVSVSLLTYTLALISIIAVDWKNFQRRCLLWWNKLKQVAPRRKKAPNANTVDEEANRVPTSNILCDPFEPCPLVLSFSKLHNCSDDDWRSEQRSQVLKDPRIRFERAGKLHLAASCIEYSRVLLWKTFVFDARWRSASNPEYEHGGSKAMFLELLAQDNKKIRRLQVASMASHDSDQLSYSTPQWWKEAIVYQIYPSSFQSHAGNTTGWGSIKGITSRLDYLKKLGVDVIWTSPFFKSPQVDMGYDIADYKDVDSRYGTLDDVDTMIAELRKRDMKLMVDLVVNHTSDQHPWFLESRSSKDNPKRDWYIWKKPREDDAPPNNWASILGEAHSAWTYDETTSEYYFSLFTPEQPDLNWENPDVRAAVWDVMHFWMQRGAAGFRLDVINLISKVTTYPDAEILLDPKYHKYQPAFKYVVNGPKLHDYLKEMNSEVLSRYGRHYSRRDAMGKRRERNITNSRSQRGRVANDIHLRPRRHRQARNPHGFKPWDLKAMRAVITRWQRVMIERNGWNAVFIENHDNPRSISHFADDSDKYRHISAKLLALMQTTLGGTLFVYQGEEIGMRNIPKEWDIAKEYKDIETQNYWNKVNAVWGDNPELLQHGRAVVECKARDHARTPMQWDASANAGFCDSGVKPWMRVMDDYETINAEAQLRPHDNKDDESVWQFWQAGISRRKEHANVFVYGDFEEITPDHPNTFAYTRTSLDGKGEKWLVLMNFFGRQTEWIVPADLTIESWVCGNYSKGEVLKPLEGMVPLKPWEGLLAKCS